MSFNLLIVNYHYFRETKPLSGIYPVTAEEFEAQLALLAKRYMFCSQRELLSWIRNREGPDGNYCLLTFDDALREQMEALEILLKRDIPAVFYVPVGPFIDDRVLSVHKLHYVRANVSDEDLYEILKVETEIGSYPFNYEQIHRQYRYDNDVAGKIKFYLNFVLSDAQKDAIIERLFKALMSDESMFVRKFYMSEDDLVKLSSLDMLGSHGTDHRPLAMLCAKDIKADIGDSLLFLEKLTSRKVKSFSYPYGSGVAVGDHPSRFFDGTSVEFAVTMSRGGNTEADLREKYLLKRIDTNDAPGGKTPMPEFL